MNDYQPEWKIYLWRKMLVGHSDETVLHSIRDFIYFDESEQRDLMLKEAQGSIDAINTSYTKAISTKTPMEVDSGDALSHTERFYNSNVENAFLGLLGLNSETPAGLTLSELYITPKYIEKYQQDVRRRAAQEEKKRIASISGGHAYRSEKADAYLRDKFCGLGSTIFNKVQNSQFLTITDLVTLMQINDPLIWQNLTFKIEIHETALRKILSDYLDEFRTGDLLGAPKMRYFSYPKQREKLIEAIKVLTEKYDSKNLRVTFEELARAGGWYLKDENHFRFYETMFSLEKENVIKIIDLVKEEIIISLTRDFMMDQQAIDEGNHPFSGTAAETAYFLDFDPKTRELVLNKEYILSTPNFSSENHNFIEYVFARPNEKITKEEIETAIKKSLGKSFHQILNDLGFKGELRKMFFPSVSKDGIIFENSISYKDFEDRKIDTKKLALDIKKLHKLRSSKK